MSKEYLDNVKKFYLASAESVDFKNAAEESRKKINSWVESQTNGRVWESSHLKKKENTFESLLCMKPALDTIWGASGVGGGFAETMEKGTADEGMVHVNVKSDKGSPGGTTER